MYVSPLQIEGSKIREAEAKRASNLSKYKLVNHSVQVYHYFGEGPVGETYFGEELKEKDCGQIRLKF